MSMHDEFDPFDEGEGRDLLGDMAPASFHAPDDWWRQLVAGLDEGRLEQLRAGGLSITVMNGDGVEKVPLEPPGSLFDDSAG
ncbi:MAG: hypothetical protein ABIP17_11725 [Ilumatobacteraceae bacterium]